jgi:hypothetical protein
VRREAGIHQGQREWSADGRDVYKEGDDTMAAEQEKNWRWCLSVCIVWGVVGLIALTVFLTMADVIGM